MVEHDIVSNSQRKKDREFIVKPKHVLFAYYASCTSFLTQNLESKNKKSNNKEKPVLKQE